MRRLFVAPQAERDIDELIFESLTRFGSSAADRYRRLLSQALNDLKLDPERMGGFVHADFPPLFRRYHLRYSRARTPLEERVGRPRHFIVYSYDDEALTIIPVLHDSMDLAKHLEE